MDGSYKAATTWDLQRLREMISLASQEGVDARAEQRSLTPLLMPILNTSVQEWVINSWSGLTYRRERGPDMMSRTTHVQPHQDQWASTLRP